MNIYIIIKSFKTTKLSQYFFFFDYKHHFSTSSACPTKQPVQVGVIHTDARILEDDSVTDTILCSFLALQLISKHCHNHMGQSLFEPKLPLS